MKKAVVFAVVLAVMGCPGGFFSPIAIGQDSAEGGEKEFSDLFIVGGDVAEEISKAVGISISPLLGMSVLGGYRYWATPENERSNLKWHQSPVFWGPLLVILLAFIAKDSAKTVLPIPKPFLVTLDAVEAVENKVSGLIALPVILSSITELDAGKIEAALRGAGLSLTSIAHAGDGLGALALSGPASTGKIALIAVFASICFFLVWLVSHTINILILLCPFSTIDFLLKMFRNFIIAALLCASLIHPWLGLAISLVIVIFAYFVAGWSFRFMVFGSIFSFDILLGRSRKYDRDDSNIKAFAGKDLPGVPIRSYGTLKRGDESALEFIYRPWLLLPSRTVRPGEQSRNFEIGIGTLGPIVLKPRENRNSYYTFFRLRPMYKTHEESAGEALGIDAIRDVTIGRGIKEGLKWLLKQLNATKREEKARA